MHCLPNNWKQFPTKTNASQNSHPFPIFGRLIQYVAVPEMLLCSWYTSRLPWISAEKRKWKWS